MCSPNNIVFTAVQATFDETFFPKCPQAVRWPNTMLQSPAPNPSTCPKGHCPCSPQEDEEVLVDNKNRLSAPLPRPDGKKGGKVVPPTQSRDDHDTDLPAPGQGESPKTTRPPTPSEEEEREPIAGPSRPKRVTQPPTKPGNVYGEKSHPVDMECRIRKKKDWESIVGIKTDRPQRKAAVPKPTQLAVQEEQSTTEDESSDSDESSEEEGSTSNESSEEDDSETEVQESLEPGGAGNDNNQDPQSHGFEGLWNFDKPAEGSSLAKLCKEGGVLSGPLHLTKSQRAVA
jgi:hypothetical protein